MSFVKIAADYADAVLGGKIPAGEFVHLACERFKRDCGRADIYMSGDAHRWCTFLSNLRHVKGRWAARGELFVMQPWQVFSTVNVYGWKWAKTDLRRFRESYEEIPRKNGKSFWKAGECLGHLCIDGEAGAEIYCGATTEDQAWEVFRPAKRMCELSAELIEEFSITANAKTLNRMGDGSLFRPVIGKPGDGTSPSAAVADEYHEHKDSDQVDTFITGMGSREQPLMKYITTAGSDMGSPCFAKRADCIDILKGTVEDDRVFAIIYGLDEDDEWDTVEAQKKANPNYGVSVSADFLEGQLLQARRSAVKQASYKTKHLNQWVGAKKAWMNMLAFQACRKRDLSLDDFKGKRCLAAIDLASRKDLAVLALLFEENGLFSLFFKYYLPEELVLHGGITRYQEWHAAGWITATPGEIIDYQFIEDDLDEMKEIFEIGFVVYDPFQATQFSTRMTDKGFAMISYGATMKNFSEPMKELDAKVQSKKIQFQMDPVALWAFGNVVATLDKKDNIFPNKERPEAKIDPAVTAIMAMGGYMRETPDVDLNALILARGGMA